MKQPLTPTAKSLLGLALLLALSGSAFGYSDYFYPQIVTGAVNPYTYMTRFTICNTGNVLNTVVLKFYLDDGTPWNVTLDSPDRSDIDGTHSTFTFTLSSFETVTLKTVVAGSGLAVGWAAIRSQHALVTNVGFTTYHDAGLDNVIDGDVGVGASPASAAFYMPVTVGLFEPVVVSDTNNGVAIANPNNRVANLRLTLYNRLGVRPTGGEATVAIPPNGHYSRFVTEIFPGVNFGNAFRGYLTIMSDTDVAPIALRMSHYILSSLPLQIYLSDSYSHLEKQEPNDDADHANTVYRLPAEITGSLVKAGGAQEIDYYRIHVNEGKTVVITPLSKNFGSIDELTVELRAYPSNTLLVSHSASTVRDPDPLVYTAPAGGGDYSIVVKGTGNLNGLSYYRVNVDSD